MESHRKDDMPPSLNRATPMGAGGIAWDAVAGLRLWLVAFTFATTAAGISDTGGFRTLVQRGVGPSNSMRKMRTAIGTGLCFLALAVGHAFGGSGESNISPVDWNSMMPAVRSVLEKEFPREAEKEYPVGIRRPGHIADITGDGITEALVLLGTGGASTSELVLMQIEDNKPAVALIKDRQGKTGPMIFLEGASAMHSDRVDLLPKEHAVFHFHFEYMGDGKLELCDGEAYRWDSHTKTFDYDSRLSTRLAQNSCSKVPRSVS